MKIRYYLLFGLVGLGLGARLHFAFADPNVPTGGGSGGGGGGGGSVTQGTVPWVDDITQWANTVLGAATAWGTAPSGNVPGVNANVLALPALPAGTNSIGTVSTTPKSGTFSSPGASVGTTPVNVLSAGTYNHVQIQNLSSSATVACSWTTTAALGTQTSFQLVPGQSSLYGPPTAGVPTTALSCVSNTASTAVYVESN